MVGHPLGGDVAEEVLAVLVLGGQFVDVGAVLAEALGDADVGGQQGGVEGPAQGFDVGVPPGAFFAAHALAAEAQVLARVGGEAGVVDPEFTQGEVALVGFAAVAVLAGFAVDVAGFDSVGLDDVGRGHRLAHGEGAPLAALAVDPGTQVETDAVDVAALLGAEVAVVFGLRGDLDVEAEVLVTHLHGEGAARGDQRDAQAQAGVRPEIEFHSGSFKGSAWLASGRRPAGPRLGADAPRAAAARPGRVPQAAVVVPPPGPVRWPGACSWAARAG